MSILLFGEVRYSSKEGSPRSILFGLFDTWRQEDYVSSKRGVGTHLTTQYQTPDNLNPQQNRPENLTLFYFYCNIQVCSHCSRNISTKWTSFHATSLNIARLPNSRAPVVGRLLRCTRNNYCLAIVAFHKFLSPAARCHQLSRYYCVKPNVKPPNCLPGLPWMLSLFNFTSTLVFNLYFLS